MKTSELNEAFLNFKSLKTYFLGVKARDEFPSIKKFKPNKFFIINLDRSNEIGKVIPIIVPSPD